MLLTITLTACLASLAPAPETPRCEDVSLTASGGYAGAMQAVTEWIAAHEGYRVQKWKARR